MLYPVDPCDGDIWDIEYTAWRNGDEYSLTVDKEFGFYAIIDGEKIVAEQLINEEYELQNDAGVVFDLKDAYRVNISIIIVNYCVPGIETEFYMQSTNYHYLS